MHSFSCCKILTASNRSTSFKRGARGRLQNRVLLAPSRHEAVFLPLGAVRGGGDRSMISKSVVVVFILGMFELRPLQAARDARSQPWHTIRKSLLVELQI
jgi:hypothetical protein